jgi:hypothetical protein
MKLNSIYPIVIILGLVSVWSCQTVVDYDDDDFIPQLVVHSFFAPDSTWEVHISQTKSIFDSNTDLGIYDARVSVVDVTTQQNIDFYHTEDGIYKTTHNPLPSHVYHLLVQDQRLGIAQAIGSVPRVDHISISASLDNNNNGDEYLNISLTSDSDQSESGTYFAWQLIEFKGGKPNPKDMVPGVVQLPEETTPFGLATTTRNLENLNFLPSEDFDTSVTDSIPSDIVQEVIEDLELENLSNNAAIKLVAISKDLYDYYETLDETQASHQSSSIQSNQYYDSNVINGTGIFGGYKETIIRF